MRILGVGVVTLDVINLVDHYPEEDEELRAQSQYFSRGGNVANTLSVLSQFDHACYWSGTLANNSSVDFILNDFSKNNIDFLYGKKIDRGKQPTSYIVLNERSGSRTIVHYRDLPELDFAHFETIPLDDFDWVHFEARGIKETAAMVRLAKKQHPEKNISIEIEKPREGLQDILNLADLYLFSKAYANKLGFDEPRRFLKLQQQHSPHADLVCSWGKQGAYALLQSGDALFSPSFSPDKVIDTLGAGDTFNAALIHSRLASKNWGDSLHFACQLAGKKCGQMGFESLAL